MTVIGQGKIAFSREQPNREIYVMNANGRGQTRLTNNSASDGPPAWGGKPSLTLVGTDGLVGTSAAGFLYAETRTAPANFLVFDATTRTSARLSLLTQQPGAAIYVFNLTADALRSMAFINLQTFVVAPLIGTGGLPPGIPAALISYDGSTGVITSVLPYTRDRSGGLPIVQDEHGVQVLRRSFLGVFDAEGNNLAPQGASEVRLDARTGKVIGVR